MIRALVSLLLMAGSASAEPVSCERALFEGTNYTLCQVDMTEADLRLFLKGPDGDVLGQFTRVDSLLDRSGKTLAFGMNAGMYHADRSPVGLYVEEGNETKKLVTRAGPGNFGLVPNGVFCVGTSRADVFETLDFNDANPDCIHATQSGPMLVIDGDLHPRFLEDGTSRYIRNGVGTTADGNRAIFVISEAPVNFHTFGRFFRDHLQLPNALYLDGNISRLYAPQIGRADPGFNLGPIIGVVVPKE